MIAFSDYSHMDIALGQYNKKADLKTAVSSLHYYNTGTWTHEAIEEMREKGLSKTNVRKDVSK